MSEDEFHEPEVFIQPTYKRPWGLLVPLGLAGFIFLLLTLMPVLLLFTKKQIKQDDIEGALVIGGIMGTLLTLTLFVLVRLYRGPKEPGNSALPLWFIRCFGIVMAAACAFGYWQNKMNRMMAIQGFFLFLGVAVAGDVISGIGHQFSKPNEEEKD